MSRGWMRTSLWPKLVTALIRDAEANTLRTLRERLKYAIDKFGTTRIDRLDLRVYTDGQLKLHGKQARSLRAVPLPAAATKAPAGIPTGIDVELKRVRFWHGVGTAR
jgi:hypothetical protein